MSFVEMFIILCPYLVSHSVHCLCFFLLYFVLQVYSIPLGGMCVRQPFSIGGNAVKFISS